MKRRAAKGRTIAASFALVAAIGAAGLLGAARPADAQTATVAPTIECAAITELTLREAVNGGRQSAGTLQRGLRSALERFEPLLKDSIVGPVTTAAATRLCQVVPLPHGGDAVTGTLSLTARYAALETQATDWLGQAVALPTPAAAGRFNRRFIALVGPAEITEKALGEFDAASGACAQADIRASALTAAHAADVKRGLQALFSADADLAAAGPIDFSDLPSAAAAGVPRICAAYGLDVDASTVLGFAERLGILESLVVDAVATLGDPAFATWVLEASTDRLRRLLGTVGSVQLLLNEHQRLNPSQACLNIDYDSVSILESDIKHLQERPNLADVLKQVEGDFASSSELVVAISDAIGIEADGCIARQVRLIVESSSSRGQTFAFSPEALAEINLDAELRPIAATIEAVSRVETPDRERWTASMTKAVEDAVNTLVTQQIDTAAATVSAAAIEVPPTPDTPNPRFAPTVPDGAVAPPPPKPPTTVFTITGPNLDLIATRLNDPDLVDAIGELPQTFLPSRDAIKANVEQGLQPFAADRRAQLIDRAEQVLGLGDDATSDRGRSAAPTATTGVVGDWTLTPEMIRALSNDVPALAALPNTTLAKLTELVGLDYPNLRLFEAALEAPPASIDATDVRSRLWPVIDIAQKRAESTDTLEALRARGLDASIDSDCGCAVEWIDNTVIYSFYPFWELNRPRDGETPRPLLDFETIDRVAFHGLEIGPDARMDASRLALWRTAGPSFVLSAHQHKVAVDLSIRISGWKDWIGNQAKASGRPAPVDTKRAAQNVGAELAAIITEAVVLPSTETLPGPESENLFDRTIRWLNQRWLSPQPDGVTLMIDGYDGTPPGDGSMEVLLALLKALSQNLEDRRMTLNIAVDIPLDKGTASPNAEPLFKDLRKLLRPTIEPGSADKSIMGTMRALIDTLLSREATPTPIDLVLVFQQRPTTDAKKTLRRQIEDSFQGEERARILRKIVPVLPSAGHANVFSKQRPGVDSGPDSQFVDDLVYFEDNFGGVGFWPSPNAGNLKMMDQVLTAFDPRRSYVLPASIRELIKVEAVPRPSDFCDVLCTNRAIAYLADFLVIGVTIGVIVLSYFSWRIDFLKRNTLIVPILVLALISANLAIAVCANSPYDWARLIVLLLVVGSVVAYLQIVRWRQGLLP